MKLGDYKEYTLPHNFNHNFYEPKNSYSMLPELYLQQHLPFPLEIMSFNQNNAAVHGQETKRATLAMVSGWEWFLFPCPVCGRW